ncbi:ribonuclease Z [Xanthocytophaga flava]|uniref:ribonuclease Z n=1 Tax=Xanthocytophaga flava TaxID=3048013 RepID=UPI0028D01F85|nr:ribonuclease Z [Xanthocytophaga flavus]MDJ1472947.1 ribonuclease Z [Xanthocytophaga flavus]
MIACFVYRQSSFVFSEQLLFSTALAFTLKILGSSSATPAFGRYPTSQLLQVEQDYFLIDCGEGTQFQLLKYQCKINRINHIVISHLHGDHFYGLVGLLATMNLNGRTEDLHLYGPPHLSDVITSQFRCSETWLIYTVHFHVLDPVQQVIYENDVMTVSTIPLNHGIPCTGFLFQEKTRKRRIKKEALPEYISPHQIKRLKEGKDLFDENGTLLHHNSDLTLSPRKSLSYAYCSDTAYYEPILEQIHNVDLLYHEATFMNSEAERALKTHHSTTHDAAQIAKLANADKLLIGHFSARYKDLLPLLEEARSIFPNTQLATEGTTISLAD